MNRKLRTSRAFTLIELVAAIGILVVVLLFASVIFKVSISSHRTAGANAEIMQKLRAITDQLNIDFKGFRKDGYLVLRSELLNRNEYGNSPVTDFRADRLFYFSTGDSQSWFPPSYVRSNISKVYFGHDNRSLYDTALPVSKWSLARDIKLVTPGLPLIDSNSISYAEFKANVPATVVDANNLLITGIPIDIQNSPDDVRGLMCQNVGEIKIEWTNGLKVPGDIMLWFGLMLPSGYPVETLGPPYIATWTPVTPEQYWPKALKFTFKIYDSKGILKQGRTFTHIVYFGD